MIGGRRRTGLGWHTVAALSLALLVACSQAQAGAVSGAIVDLDAASLTGVRAFSVRDAQGSVWRFGVAEAATDEDGRPLNASHLREHMLNGEQVVVEYRRESDRLVAQRVTHR